MDSEVRKVIDYIKSNNHFVLHGGAGSGKTYTLIELLNYLYNENPYLDIACITYTNVAVNEIKDRAPYDTLQAFTIHDFLWNIIKEYQINIKQSIITLVKSQDIRFNNNDENIGTLEDIYSKRSFVVEYKEWRDIGKGIVSHDEIPIISEHMFKTYPLLCKIISDKLDYVFVDEYQDTDQAVISILMEHINKDNKLLIGFFGDKMQSIYGSNSIDISSYISDGIVKEVVKEENRRNPKVIINAVNKIRKPFDDLMQEPADDPLAPNYNKEGMIKFLYSKAQVNIEELKASTHFKGWDFSNAKEAKELYLTYRLIGPIAGFQELLDIYSNDKILRLKDKLKKHVKDNQLDEPEVDILFGEALTKYHVTPTQGMQEFIDQHSDLFEKAKQIKYSELKNVYVDREQLTGNVKSYIGEDTRNRQDPRNALSKHLCKVQYYIELFKSKQYNELINQIDIKITSVSEKIKINKHFEVLIGMCDCKISEVIEYANKHNICIKDDNFISYVDKNAYIYNRVKEVSYREVINLYRYIEGYTIYSTQHNIKGAEFSKVFVVLDNGAWNQYNFKYLFENSGSDSVIDRTRKIFYVCCTRAMDELIIYYPESSENVLCKAKEWFGEDNIIQV